LDLNLQGDKMLIVCFFFLWTIYIELIRKKNISYESVPIQELTTSLCNLLALMHPEDGGDTILRNVGSYKSHTVSSPRR
jgi:hypothetical protein